MENKATCKRKTILGIVVVILVVAVAAILIISFFGNKADKIPGYIENGEWDKVVEVYNEDVAGSEKEAEYKSLIENAISDISLSWSELSIDTEEAVSALSIISEIEDNEVSSAATDAVTFIKVEDEGNNLYEEAEGLFSDGQTFKAIKKLYQIDSEYSQFGDVQQFITECKTILLAEASLPETIDDYDKSILEMGTCYEIAKDEDYNEKLQQLQSERTDFNNAIESIQTVDTKYKAGDYKQAFTVIQNAVQKDPNNRFLNEEFEEIENTYIASVIGPVKEKTENKKYKEALEIIDNAQQVYECEEFNELEVIVKKQRNPAYRLTKNIQEKIQGTLSGWDFETFDVKSAGEGAKKYIEKSEEKLWLGDYSDEEITLYSFTGSVVAALSGLDIVFDLRDISYDIVHWGEEEYFVFWLAVDVVALVPVCGVVKYLKYAGKLKGPAKQAAKLLDTTTEAGKAAAKVIDDCAKPTKGAKLAEKCSKIKLGHYKKYLTRGTNFPSNKHPITGIEYVEKKVNYKNGNHGNRIKAKFPVFDSRADVLLPEELFKATDAKQFAECNKALYKQMEKNPELKRKFSEEELEKLKKAETPDGYTWHHNEEEGLMQLVDRSIHEKTGHTGGRKFWGNDSVQ